MIMGILYTLTWLSWHYISQDPFKDGRKKQHHQSLKMVMVRCGERCREASGFQFVLILSLCVSSSFQLLVLLTNGSPILITRNLITEVLKWYIYIQFSIDCSITFPSWSLQHLKAGDNLFITTNASGELVSECLQSTSSSCWALTFLASLTVVQDQLFL